MSATIKEISYYPIKGFAGAGLDVTDLTRLGVPGDRAHAFIFADALVGPLEGQSLESLPWVSKGKIAVQNDWPALAALEAQFDKDGRWVVRTPHGSIHCWDFSDARDRASAARFVSEYLQQTTPSPAAKHPQATPVQLVGAFGGSTRFPDREKEHVSILNLATLRDLEARVGRSLDMRRFRGNLIIDGVEPWAEVGLIKKRVTVGGAELEISNFIVRCHNVNVAPDVGVADVELLPVLRDLSAEKTPYKVPVFGVLARVIQPGRIAVDDTLNIHSV